MKTVALGRDKYALVDDGDLLWLLLSYSWTLSPNGYVKSENSDLLMHRLIAEKMGLNLENFIDHEDRNKLNNQRHNLRPATNSQNQMNRKANLKSSTGFRGVHLDSERQKFRVAIQLNGKSIFIGRFTCPVEAAKAYDKAAKIHHGEFAILNFPEEISNEKLPIQSQG